MALPDSPARAALDAAHSNDPVLEEGRPAEALYSDRLEAWLLRLVPQPSPALALAARAQHLERWVIARSEYPMDRAGYHAWRTAVQKRQGSRAEELLVGAGVDAAIASRVNALVAKASKDDEGQALEDAACLVFLEHELADFAASHADYTHEKLVSIVRRTWRKMSPEGHALAGTIPLSAELSALVQAATTS